MNEAKLRSLLTQRLMAIDPQFPTERENVAFLVVENRPYQSVNLLKGETQNPTLGTGYKMEVGIFQISLMYPFNTGTKEIDAKIDAIKAQFPRGWTANDGPDRILVPRSPYASAGMRDGGFWRVPVTVPYVVKSFSS